jgi:hypothetical protein
MFTVEKGLSISPWWIVLGLGLPFSIAIWHFFAKLLPDGRQYLFPHRPVSQIVLTVLSCYVVFAFFGLAGIHRYGEISHWLSMVSLFVLFPVTLIVCWPRQQEPAPAAGINSSVPESA